VVGEELELQEEEEAEEQAARRDVCLVDKDEGLVDDEHLREFFEGLIKLVDGFAQLGIIATKEDVFVGEIDVLHIGLLEDCFRLPSERYKGDDLEVARMRGLVLGGEWKYPRLTPRLSFAAISR